MEYNLLSLAPIVLCPLVAFIVNALIGKKLPRQGDFLSIAAIFISFIYSFRIFNSVIFNTYASDFYIHRVFEWFNLSYDYLKFEVKMGKTSPDYRGL